MQEEGVNTLLELAWFPALRGGGKEHLVSTVCACMLIFKKFLENRITNGISVTLSSVRQPISLQCGRYLPPSTLCERLQRNNESTQLFAYKNHLRVCPFQLQHLMTIFPLKFTNRLKQNDADRYCQSDVISDFKSPECVSQEA